MMRKLLVAVVVAAFVAALSAANVSAEQPGQVPQEVLADLGLGGMEIVSDVEGEQIRGKWYFDISLNFGPNTVSNAIQQWVDLNALGGATTNTGNWGGVDILLNGTYILTIPINLNLPETAIAQAWRQQVLNVNAIYKQYYPNGIGPYGPRNLGLRPVW